MSRLRFPAHAPALSEAERAALWLKSAKFSPPSTARAPQRGCVEVEGVPSYVTQAVGEFGQIRAK